MANFKLNKAVALLGIVAVTVVLAATYGPFRCDNGCDARNPADGLTREFISSTVNAHLEAEAKKNKTEHVWRPGDELKLCDGKWCVTLDYHPLTGLFIWKPTKPAWPDQGTRGYDVRVGYTPEEMLILSTLFKKCLDGLFIAPSSIWTGTDTVGSYSDGERIVIVGQNAFITINHPDEFCGF